MEIERVMLSIILHQGNGNFKKQLLKTLLLLLLLISGTRFCHYVWTVRELLTKFILNLFTFLLILSTLFSLYFFEHNK